MVLPKRHTIPGRIVTHYLRVTIKGLDEDPGINPVAGYVDTLKWDKPVRVLDVTIMPGVPDNAMDLVMGVTLGNNTEAVTSNAQFAALKGLVAVTGSAIPPVPPTNVALLGGAETLIAQLHVYQSNASFSKTSVILAVLNVHELGPPIYKV